MFKVTVDMDGVVADFVGHVYGLYQDWYGVGAAVDPDTGKAVWQYEWVRPVMDYLHFPSKTQFWKWINEVPEFWASMPPIRGAMGALRELMRDPEVQVQFVTSRGGLQAGKETQEWFRRWMGRNLTMHTYLQGEVINPYKAADILTGVPGTSKHLVTSDLHIDDTPKVLEAFPSYRRVLLFRQPWNWDNQAEFHSVSDWNGVLRHTERLRNVDTI